MANHEIISDPPKMVKYVLWDFRCPIERQSVAAIPHDIQKFEYCPFCGEPLNHED